MVPITKFHSSESNFGRIQISTLNCVYHKLYYFGQWLWLSWQNGRFWFQMSAVWTESSAKFYNENVYLLLAVEKTENKGKRAWGGPIFKNYILCAFHEVHLLWDILINRKCRLGKVRICLGSGCGLVGRVVASDTRGPRFESSHRQNLCWTFVYLFTINCIEKTKIKKEAGNGTLFKKRLGYVRYNVSTFN